MPEFAPIWGSRTFVMGVLNLTPDSFSNDGISRSPADVTAVAERMVAQGVDILDVGGESSRPGSTPVSSEEELDRVMPALRRVTKLGVPVSVDTRKSAVARRALAEGATIVNDVSGLRDPQMLSVVADSDAWLVLVHNRPRDPAVDIMTDVGRHLEDLVSRAEERGIPRHRIIIDPGFGFNKEPRENLEVMRRLHELRRFGQPLLIGASRKGTIGKILDTDVEQRLEGSLAMAALAVAEKVDVVRVHDVWESVSAVRMMDAVIRR